MSANPMAIAANEAHKKAYGAEPGAFFLNAYSAILALLSAIEQGGSTDYAVVANALRSKNVETPLGNIGFDERGDAIGVEFFTMFQVQNGIIAELNPD